MIGQAMLSEDGRYRYELWRLGLQESLLGDKGTVAFCMLNPSTADADQDDPTIRRCIGFAKRWGYGSLAVVNLWAYRATDPKALTAWLTSDERRAEIAAGINAEWENARHQDRVLNQASLRIAAWGAYQSTAEAMGLLDRYTWHALGLTRHGYPRHPLYLRADTEPRMLYRKVTWKLA